MPAERIVIVGAGPAGLATARAYREHGGRGSVTLLGEEQLLPYRRPPLTKEFLRGEIGAAQLPIEQRSWFATHDVSLRLGAAVTAIDPQGAYVTVAEDDALEQGEVARCALAGVDASWDAVPGFWSTIGTRTLKYAAWGDGYEQASLVAHREGAFTVWYSRDGATVGVLTHNRDADYERGRELISARAPAP